MKESIVGIIAGILTSVSMLPQLIKIIRRKDVGELSLATIITLIAGTGFWVYYGLLRAAMPIIITNSLAILVNCILLICYLLFRRTA